MRCHRVAVAPYTYAYYPLPRGPLVAGNEASASFSRFAYHDAVPPVPVGPAGPGRRPGAARTVTVTRDDGGTVTAVWHYAHRDSAY